MEAHKHCSIFVDWRLYDDVGMEDACSTRGNAGCVSDRARQPIVDTTHANSIVVHVDSIDRERMELRRHGNVTGLCGWGTLSSVADNARTMCTYPPTRGNS